MDEQNFLQLLPDEVKLQLCTFLPLIDLVNVTKCWESYQSFIKRKDVVVAVNATNAYDLTFEYLTNYLCDRLVLKYVRVLNITGLYWIKEENLIILVQGLPVLESLFAADTKMDLFSILPYVYNMINLKKLSITYRNVTLYKRHHNRYTSECSACFSNLFKPLSQLTHLFIYYNDLNSYSILESLSTQDRKFFVDLMALESFRVFWLVNYERIVKDNLDVLKNKLQKIMFEVVVRNNYKHIFFDDIFYPNLNKSLSDYYHNTGFFIQKTDEFINAIENIECLADIDACIDDKIEIQDGTLNVSCRRNENNGSVASKQNIEELFKVFNNADIRLVRKITVCFCTWCENRKKICLKRKRDECNDGSIENESAEIFADYLWEQCSSIESFELICCSNGATNMSMGIFEDYLQKLHQWKWLKQVYLNLDHINNGEFLVNICRDCPKLEVIKISSGSPCDSLFINLCAAVKHAETLKDFRCEMKFVTSVIPLIDSLSRLVNLKRIYIKCYDENTNLSNLEQSIINFWESKTSLIFFELVVNIATSLLHPIFKNIKLILASDTSKVFLLKSLETAEENEPMVHYTEIISPHSDFGSVDFLKCFSYY